MDLPNGHHSQSLVVVTVDKRGDLRYITNIHIACNYMRAAACMHACTCPGAEWSDDSGFIYSALIVYLMIAWRGDTHHVIKQ